MTIKKVFSFLCLFLWANISIAEKISEISISGNTTVSRGTVLSYLPVEIGDEYSENLSNLTISSLYQTGYFSDIEVSFENKILKLNLKENPTIKYFEVKGYKNDKVLNEKKLELAILDAKLSAGNLYNKQLFYDFVNVLKKQYTDSGYLNAKFDYEIDQDSANRIGIEINIDEGEGIKITNFEIKGSKDFEEGELLDLFDIGEPDIFFINFWTEKDQFSNYDYDAGIENLKSFFLAKGYLEFEILTEDMIYSDDNESVDIRLKIFEGPRYVVNNIVFNGDFLNIPKEKLFELFALKNGDIFNRKEIISGLEKINDFFGNQGFAFVKVDADSKEDKVNKQVNLDISVNVNERVYLNRITISGNTRTQDDVIRREINLLEGQQYSTSELEKSLENIKRLGYFSNVDMKTTKQIDEPDKINLHFTVDENKTGQFSIGLSQSNSTGAAFTLGVQEKNFLGTGNTLNAKLVSSEAVEEISFFFLDPDFNNKKHSLSYGLFSKTIDSKYIDLGAYTINEIGFNGSYGIPVSEYGVFTNGFRYSSLDLQCGSIYSLYEANQCSKGKGQVDLSLTSTVRENSLNDSIYPTNGRYNNVSASFSLPITDINYYKFDFNHKSYYELNDTLTLKLGADVGYIDSYSEKDTPFYKKYFGGGASSIRGFELNSIGPTYSNGTVKGGEVSILGTTSIISPLTFLEDSDMMRIGAFAEMGGIYDSATNLKFDDLKSSVGVAFGWYTPIGPIGVHWAKPITTKNSDRLESFAFTLGSAF